MCANGGMSFERKRGQPCESAGAGYLGHLVEVGV